MKKSILFGALAFFAISAMGIQDANAQNEVKVKKAETTAVSEEQGKPSTSTVSQVPVKQKKDDCCAEKKEAKDCCAEKKVSADKKDSKECCAEKKDACETKVKAERKDEKKASSVKPRGKKAGRDKKVKHVKTDAK